MLYIGIDLGTSSVKLLLMDEKGQIKKTVTRGYPLFFPHPGWSEQQPEDWWKAITSGIQELIATCNTGQIAGISFGGQMHGLVMLDREDNVIRPAILWNDGRTNKEKDYLNEQIGKKTLSDCTANIAFTGFTAPKILWVKANEPENFAKINKIMLTKDYIAYKLTGICSTDVSDASGMLLMDVKNKCWSQEMLKICGITQKQLPDIYESYEIVGTLKEEAAQLLGLKTSCKVIAGAGDNAAAAIGTGTIGEGSCNISLGTSGTVFIASEKFRVDKNNALHAFAHADGHYHLMGCILSAASCNKWWMEEILETKQYSKEQERIHQLGKNNVFFLPYLMGERSPHNDPDARGTFIGMTMASTRTDMTQAVLEGVAFAIRDSVEIARSLGIDIKSTRICGGGAKSLLWKKIIANVLNVEVQTVVAEEGPAYGAALLAAVGCGEFSSVKEAVEKTVKIKECIEPDSVLTANYDKCYEKFKVIYPTIKEVYKKIKV